MSNPNASVSYLHRWTMGSVTICNVCTAHVTVYHLRLLSQPIIRFICKIDSLVNALGSSLLCSAAACIPTSTESFVFSIAKNVYVMRYREISNFTVTIESIVRTFHKNYELYSLKSFTLPRSNHRLFTRKRNFTTSHVRRSG